jgi:hypothetical protein
LKDQKEKEEHRRSEESQHIKKESKAGEMQK